MSLIHDALKKAQGEENAPLGSGMTQFQESPDEEGKKNISKRTLILGGVLVLALVIFVVNKFISKHPASQAPATVSQAGEAQPSPMAPVSDVGKLKRAAIDAYSTGDYDAAWSNLQLAAQMTPDDPEIWNNTGLVARKRGDVVKAREAYSKALGLKADYPECLNNMAVLEMQSGNTGKAKELLEKALALAPANPEANFHMALLNEMGGDKKRAVEYYKRFVTVGTSLPSSTVDAVRDHIMEIE